MYLLLNMVIFQPAMLVFRGVYLHNYFTNHKPMSSDLATLWWFSAKSSTHPTIPSPVLHNPLVPTVPTPCGKLFQPVFVFDVWSYDHFYPKNLFDTWIYPKHYTTTYPTGVWFLTCRFTGMKYQYIYICISVTSIWDIHFELFLQDAWHHLPVSFHNSDPLEMQHPGDHQLHVPKTNSSPLKIGHPKGKLVPSSKLT